MWRSYPHYFARVLETLPRHDLALDDLAVEQHGHLLDERLVLLQHELLVHGAVHPRDTLVHIQSNL